MELKLFTLISLLSVLSLSYSEDSKLTLEEVKGQLHSFVKKGFENLERKAPSSTDSLYTRNHHGKLVANRYIKSLRCLEEGIRRTAKLISKSMGVAEGESHLDVLKELTFSNAEREVAAETCNVKHLLEKKNSKGEKKIGMDQKETPKMNNEESLHHTRTCPFTAFNETREFDASNNNLETGCGRSEDIFSRLIEEPRYNGPDCAMDTFGRRGFRMPRVISNALSDGAGTFFDPTATLMLMQWGQFIDHDVTEFGETVDSTLCCNSEIDNPSCVNIQVPDDDPTFEQGTCIPFARSLSTLAQAMGERSHTQKRDQDEAPACENRINFATSFVDGSQIYGNSVDDHDVLRNIGTPFMLTASDSEAEMDPVRSRRHAMCGEVPSRFLPYLPSDPLLEDENEFIAGDERVTEQPGLTSMHHVWVRYHNLIASGILNNRGCRFSLTSDEVFNIAREFVIASVQHITYNEFLPVIFSESSRADFNLNSPFSYDPSIVARIDHEFATAAYRMGHTLLPEEFPIAGREEGPLPLSSSFFNGSIMRLPDSAPSDLLLSLGSTSAMAFDLILTPTIRNLLFTNTMPPGLDLLALNLQRGRDHGLSSANAYRSVFGLAGGLSEDLLREGARTAINTVYRRRANGVFRNIDLFPAGLAEEPSTEENKLGDVFTSIILNQFSKLKFGDRFWYENGRFSEEELAAIRGTTLTDILCETSLVDSLPEKSMLQYDPLTNPFVSCFSRRSNREGTVLGLIEAASRRGLYDGGR